MVVISPSALSFHLRYKSGGVGGSGNSVYAYLSGEEYVCLPTYLSM